MRLFNIATIKKNASFILPVQILVMRLTNQAVIFPVQILSKMRPVQIWATKNGNKDVTIQSSHHSKTRQLYFQCKSESIYERQPLIFKYKFKSIYRRDYSIKPPLKNTPITFPVQIWVNGLDQLSLRPLPGYRRIPGFLDFPFT